MKNLVLFLLAGMVLFSCRKDLNSKQTQTFHPRSYTGTAYTNSYDEAAVNLDDSEDELINKAIIIAALALEDYICDETFQDALLNYLSNNNQEFMWLSDLMDILSESQAYDQRIEQTNPFTNFSGFTDLADIDDNLEHTGIDYGIAIGVLLGSAPNENPLFVTGVELDDIDSTYEDNVLGWLPGEAGNLNSPIYVSEEIAFSNLEGLVISISIHPKEEPFYPKNEFESDYDSPSQAAKEEYFDEEAYWELPRMVIKNRYEKSGRSEIAIVGKGVDPITDGTWKMFYSHSLSIYQDLFPYYFGYYPRMVKVSANDINSSYVHVGSSWYTITSGGSSVFKSWLKKRPKDVAVNRILSGYENVVGMYYTIYERDWSQGEKKFMDYTDSVTNREIKLAGRAKYISEWYIHANCSGCNSTVNQSSQVPKSELNNETQPYVNDLSRIKLVWEDYYPGVNP